MPVDELPILVIGSGISGLVLGIALRRLGFAVALFDKVQQLHAAGSGSAFCRQHHTHTTHTQIDFECFFLFFS